VNTVTASFNADTRQMTEMSQRKKTVHDQCSLQFLIMLRGKKAGALNHNLIEQKLINLLQRAVSK